MGQRNGRGDMLVDFCAFNNLCITNTFFKQTKESKIWTWESPNGRDRNQIDYILVNTRYKESVKNSRTFQSADVGSDHQLLLATFKLKRGYTTTQSGSQRVDITRLAQDGPRSAYRQSIEAKLLTLKNDGEYVEECWCRIKSILQSTAIETLAFAKRKQPEVWFTESTIKLTEERRKYMGLRSMSTGFSKHHNYLCREVKRSARRDKEQYIGVICDKIEKSRNQNKSREVFEAIRKLTGSYAPRPFAVKDKEGNLITVEEKVKTCWREYYSELYNDPNEVDESSVQMGSCNPDPEPDIIISEVHAAL